jgi:D-arabinose 1-dehydrogenase-like Zn-dependent alcohol dehydrogenase
MAGMTALRAHRRGGPEVLVVERAPIPVPAPGEVLVEVHAAAITFDELTWDESWLHDGVDRAPTIPSHEVSGVVAATGPDVTDIAVGDEVYGLIPFDRDGAAAEYVAVPADCLAARPTTCSHVYSAALPLAGLTAWQALVDHAAVHPGERVLIHGGTGGVGAEARHLAVLRNWEFSRASVAGIVCMHRDLGYVDAVGVAMFLQTFLLALAARGLGSCVQVSVAGYPDVCANTWASARTCTSSAASRSATPIRSSPAIS